MAQTTTMTLTAFLAARLDEDEAKAQKGVVVSSWPDVPSGTPGRHFTPERQLREVEAKRAIVALHLPAPSMEEVACSEGHVVRPAGPLACPECNSGSMQGICHTLRHLAAVYADHADYREEWRP